MAIGFIINNRRYIPDKNAKVDIAPRVLKADFGDGNQQRLAHGRNPIRRSWQLSFNNRDPGEIATIVGFLTERGGVGKFDYSYKDSGSADGDTTISVICNKWSEAHTTDITSSLTCIFEQVYD